MSPTVPTKDIWRMATVVLAVVVLFFVSAVAISAGYRDRIVFGSTVGTVSVGTLTREDAARKIQERLDVLEQRGVSVQIGTQYEVVQADRVGLDINIQEAIELAYERGHQGSVWQQGWERFSALWSRHHMIAPVTVDDVFLDDRIDELGQLSHIERKDIRWAVEGTRVELLTDTRPGKRVDDESARKALMSAFEQLSTGPVSAALLDDAPRASMESGVQAERQAVTMIARSIRLDHGDLSFTITRTMLASWLTNEYEENRLVPGVDIKSVSQYITRIASQLNVPPIPAGVETEDGTIIGFTPPEYGRAVEEEETVALVVELLKRRRDGSGGDDVIVVSTRRTSPPEVSLGDGVGISELIGRATTLFTGSPKNRVWNITNGARFLSGIVVEPGEEFSTLGELGTIDNTTGYLPELVIKGDRTIPEYGGGLCQVSTTLFRAIMDAGLPVSDRRNHSRRVGYYEKDEHGQYIGPGLDATIYENAPDLKFVNDTGNPVLVISYVQGTKITFELYGTKDGRSSQIIGPTVLTEVDPGEPIYIETDELAPGEVKQVEWAIPGGSAVATYIITHEDGTQEEQEFRSYYRKWPDKFLIGRGDNILTKDPTEGLFQ